MILGSRWTAQIIRELLNNDRRRFQDFSDGLDCITPATLSNRLKILEESGVVARKIYATHPPRADYVLTAKGKKMAAIIGAMRDWGVKHG